MSARSKVRVRELGLLSSHIGAQRTERKVVRWKFSPIADKHARKMHYRHSHGCEIHSRAWSSADRGTPREKWRWHRGRKEGGAGVGATAGRMRRRWCRFWFWDIVRAASTVRAEGVRRRARQATEGESEVLKLSERQGRSTGKARKEISGLVSESVKPKGGHKNQHRVQNSCSVLTRLGLTKLAPERVEQTFVQITRQEATHDQE